MVRDDDKKLGVMTYIVAIALMLALIAINELFLFNQLSAIMPYYFSVVILVNIVINSVLANTTYYTSRVKIDQRYITISLLLFILTLDYMIALMLIAFNPEKYLAYIALYLGFGRIFLILGMLLLHLKVDISRICMKIRWMIVSCLVVLILQIASVHAVMFLKLDLDSILFVTDGLSVTMLIVLNYELVLADRTNNSHAILFAFFVMLISQVVLALSPLGYEAQIDSYVLLAVGLGFFFFHVNRNNVIIPQREQDSLLKQFNLYSLNLKKIIDKKTYQVTEANDKIIAEIEYAKSIQQSLLPAADAMYRDVRIISSYFPCEQLSGDFYDHYKIDEDNIAIFLLDVSGHGISAALLTMFCNNMLKTNDRNLQLMRSLKPEKALEYFYNQFNRINFPDEMHMVVFYATLNLNTRMLTYCTGGLNCSPIRVKRNGKAEFLDRSEGFAICKLAGLVTPEYRSERIKLDKGDRLLFYTDGLVDKEKNKTMEVEDLVHHLQINRHLSIEELNESILKVVNPNRKTLNDDITYVLVEI